MHTMDEYDISTAPQAFLEVKWIEDIFVVAMGLGWTINYVCMVLQSFRDRTYSMAIIPLCCNIAWEFVHSFIYPPASTLERLICTTWVIVDGGVIYAAIKYSPREWGHAPLVEKHLPLIFATGVFGCITGHLALIAEIGPYFAYFWGAMFCQIILSIGGLGQLLARGSTRGGSYTLWLTRYIGTCLTVVPVTYRILYWPALSWMYSPLLLWAFISFLLLDGAYGVCFYYIRRKEIEAEKTKCN